MATSQQLPRTVQPPPDLPSMPDVSTTLSGYLRNFSLWCRHGFADKLSVSTAAPGVLLQANDAPAGTTPVVFMLQVTTAGAIVLTPQPLGSGKP
jgi:hypothetical protein